MKLCKSCARLYFGKWYALTRVVISREEKNLEKLSQLGHFLKGSSATLGLTKVKDSCTKIQHFGAKKDEDGTTDLPNEATCLARIEKTIKEVKEEYAEVEKTLKKFFGSS